MILAIFTKVLAKKLNYDILCYILENEGMLDWLFQHTSADNLKVKKYVSFFIYFCFLFFFFSKTNKVIIITLLEVCILCSVLCEFMEEGFDLMNQAAHNMAGI